MGVVYHTGNMRSKRNMLINSDFKINQRAYVSGTNTTVSNQYTLDRWRIPTSGQNVTFSGTNGVVTITAPASGIEQVIENVSNKGGEFTVYNQGTAVVTVSQSSDNVTYTIVTPTNGVYNITGGNYIKVNFASGTVKLPTFKDGSVVDTVWHPYDGEFGGEVQACQRYYWSQGGGLYEQFGSGTCTSTYCDLSVWLPVKMRIPPTFSYSGALSNFQLTDGLGANTPTSIVLQDSPFSTNCCIRAFQALTAGRAIRMLSNNSASSRLNFSAEL